MVSETTHRLHIMDNRHEKDITHLSANETRVLVGVPINLQHKNDQIICMFDNKIRGYIDKLLASTLRSFDIMFGYQHYW